MNTRRNLLNHRNEKLLLRRFEESISFCYDFVDEIIFGAKAKEQRSEVQYLMMQAQNMSLPKELRVPLWSWSLQIYGLCMAVFFFGFSIWMLGQAKHPLGWSPFVIIAFWIVISAATDIRQTITISRTLITEAGQEVKKRKHTIFYRWEDVVRYEPYGREFALRFQNGEMIRFPMEAKNFKDIKIIALEKIESIGTFEDGRKVPRELFSISITFLLWMVAVIVIVAAAIVLLKLRK